MNKRLLLCSVLLMTAMAAEAQSPNLGLSMTGPLTPLPADAEHVITYVVTNSGTVASQGVFLDLFRSREPPVFTLTPVSSGVFDPPICVAFTSGNGTPIYRCDVGNVNPGQVVVITGRYVATPPVQQTIRYSGGVYSTGGPPGVPTEGDDNSAQFDVQLTLPANGGATANVPTLSEWALAVLAVACAVAAFVALRR